MRRLTSARRLRPQHDSDEPDGNDASDERKASELQKLRMEIVDLRRSPWLKPSVSIPIFATLATLALSQYLGVFELERKRIVCRSKR
jgi:hypothetical protein